MCNGGYLDFGNCVSNVFDTSTGIWWHCDDEDIIKISDLLEGVILEKFTEKQFMSGSKIYCLWFISEQAI